MFSSVSVKLIIELGLLLEKLSGSGSTRNTRVGQYFVEGVGRITIIWDQLKSKDLTPSEIKHDNIYIYIRFCMTYFALF